MTLGGFLKQLRQGSGQTGAQWADAAGVSRMSVFRWETDRVIPHIYELESALKAAGATTTQQRYALSLREAGRQKIGKAIAFDQERSGLHRGDLLRALRGRKQWTSEETARRAGINATQLSRWESLHAWPDDARIHQLAYVLDASEEELLVLCGGISNLELLAPPTLTELQRIHGQVSWRSGSVSATEPLILALSYRYGILWRDVRRDTDDARHHTNAFVSLNYFYAMMLMREGRTGEARLRIRRAEEYDLSQLWPGSHLGLAQAKARLLRGYTLPESHRRQKEIANELQRLQNSVSLWEKQTSLPWQAAMASERAFARFYAGDAEAALTESDSSLKTAAVDNPDDALLRLPDRARLLYEMGRYEQLAEEMSPYEGCIHKDFPHSEHNISLNLYIGLAYLSLGDSSSAHPYLTRAETQSKASHRIVMNQHATEALSRLSR